MREMINSDELLAHIARHRAESVYFFLPYMFGTTYWGAQVCPERAWLIPCLHDEAYAHLTIYEGMFERAHGLLFLSRARDGVGATPVLHREQANLLDRCGC